jgi:hypothetical protein
VGLDLDVIIDADATFLPLREDIWLGGKRLEGRTFYLLKQCAAACTEVACDAIIELRNEPANGVIELGKREERAITDLG